MNKINFKNKKTKKGGSGSTSVRRSVIGNGNGNGNGINNMNGTVSARSAAKKAKVINIIEVGTEESELVSNFLAILTKILGDFNVIPEIFKNNNFGDIEIINVERKASLGRIDKSFEGLIFVGDISSGGHFHYKLKGEKSKDSYTLGYQRSGSNGFCQTFAIMCYLIEKQLIDNQCLQKDNYYNNTICALKFIQKYCLKAIQKVWKETCKSLSDTIWYNYHDLNVKELKEDIDKIIKSEIFLRFWLTNEFIYKFK